MSDHEYTKLMPHDASSYAAWRSKCQPRLEQEEDDAGANEAANGGSRHHTPSAREQAADVELSEVEGDPTQACGYICRLRLCRSCSILLRFRLAVKPNDTTLVPSSKRAWGVAAPHAPQDSTTQDDTSASAVQSAGARAREVISAR